MSAKIAILEGWKMPRRRKSYRGFGRRYRGFGASDFSTIAKRCKKKHKKSTKLFWKCVSAAKKRGGKGRRKGRVRRVSRDRWVERRCPPGCTPYIEP